MFYTEIIMKRFLKISSVVLFSIFAFSCSGGSSYVGTSSESSTQASSSTTPAATSSAMSEMELAVITEMSYARTKPAEYVSQRLQPLVEAATGTYLEALNECITQMNAMSALPALTAADGLYKCANEWVVSSGPAGTIGHDPNLSTRISKYCTWSSYGENCSYGYNTAEKIVVALLIDDGEASRGHRKNILSSAFTHAGAAIGSHATYTTMCCIDFASGYAEK